MYLRHLTVPGVKVKLPTVTNYHYCYYYYCRDIIGAIIGGCTNYNANTKEDVQSATKEDCTSSESTKNDIFNSA